MFVTTTCVNTISQLTCSKMNLDTPTYTPQIGKTDNNDETHFFFDISRTDLQIFCDTK